MKAAHTGRVRRIARRLAAAEGLHSRAVVLAEMAGLLHDAGRFEQYRRHRTFRDAQSVHHGRLAVSVIRTHGLLDDLKGIERRRVLSAVAHHNEMRLHPLADPSGLILLKLLRDADKLDILAMVAARIHSRRRHGPLADLNVPASGSCSPAVASAISAGRVVGIAKVRSRCDALLFFLSWVFDLNFPAATRQFLDSGWFDRLAAAVAPAGGVRGLVRKARTYAALHAAGARAARLPV
jgi:HD superfamily phosphohydrolase YqeK